MSWDPLWVSSSLYSLAFGKPIDLPRTRLWIRFSSSHFWSLLHWRHLSGVLPASVVDCCLSSLRAGVCSHLWERRGPAGVLLVAWLPLPRVWRSAPAYIPLICSDRILTCRIKSIRSPAKVGLVVTELITSPVVSWEGWETPLPQHRGSAVILCSTTGVVRPLCSCGDLLLSSARLCLRLVDVDWNTFSSWMSIFLSFFIFI